ncbi:MAG TPA: TolC family protein [Chroococcales cyanobacterium]|jgi:outer membrane protein TolC
MPRFFFLFTAAFLISCPAALSLPKEMSDLSVDQAIAIAMQKNPQVLAAQQQVLAAEAQMAQQGNWLVRSLTANLGYNPNGLAQGGIGVAVNVGDLLNGFQQEKIVASNLQIARHNLRQVKLSVAAAVTAASADYQNQKRIAEIRREAIKAAQSDTAVIERLFARGNATIGDLAKVRLNVSQSRIDLSESEGNLQKAWMTLVQQMGDSDWLEKSK